MLEDKLSFIPPKKTESSFYQNRGPGILIIISFLLFLVSVLLYGGFLLYKNKIKQEADTLNDSLVKAHAAFEFPLINELNKTSEEIGAVKSLLDQHVTPLPIFDLLEKDTLKSVRFITFKYLREKDSPTISLEGTAKDYTTLALQGEVFEKDQNIKDVSFSNLNLGERGTVNFRVKLTLDSSIISYKTE